MRNAARDSYRHGFLRSAILQLLVFIAISTIGSIVVDRDAQAQACGGDGQRACCLFEAPFGACMAGLLEIPGCTGDCTCSSGAQASSSCVLPTPCGGSGQRACCFGESGFGACEAGLIENAFPNAGFCTNLPGTQSSSICLPPTSCGGANERACCAGEAGFGACQTGLVEEPVANTGQCNNLAPGIESQGICRTTTPCGSSGERACCAGEPGANTGQACDSGLVEIPQANSGQCSNLAWGIQSSGICAAITPCGGVNQRACCVGEAGFGACDIDPGTGLNLVEEPVANTGQCGNLAPGIQSQGLCRASTECGGAGQRACCAGETGFGACMEGFVETPQANSGQCSNLAWGIQSSGICELATPCGGVNERACCAGEAGFGACDIDPGTGLSLVEEPIPNTGQCSNLAPGIQSQGLCRASTACGGDGNRACCVGESGFGACEAGLAEVSQANSGQCSNLAWGTQSSSACQGVTPCGGPGERACCLGESTGACTTGVTEVVGCGGDCLCANLLDTNAIGTCVVASPCGGAGQRACCVGEAAFGACEAGVTEIPGCTGDCFCGGPGNGAVTTVSTSTCGVLTDPGGGFIQIAEPDLDCTNCAPAAQPQSSYCSLRGIADMHTHMFADVGHGGAAFVGKPYDPVGGVNEALKQDYGTHMDVVGAYEGGLPPAHVADGLPPDCPPYLLNTGVCDGQVLWHGDHLLFDDPTGTGSGDKPAAPLGSPTFNGWPNWRTTVHQQMYFKWVERAYRGGLRLMVMHAVHSEVFCEVSVQINGVNCADSMAQIDLQLQAAYDFQTWLDSQSGGPGQGWFRIVTTPIEARAAISQGKLAVTLGIEVDNLFNCKADIPGQPPSPCPNMPGHPELTTVQEAIDFYYDWGVRHVFPVHNFDNKFAGTATWLNPLAAGNRYVEGQWSTMQDCAASPFGAEFGFDGELGYGFRHDNIGVDFLRAAACAVSNGPLFSCDLGDIAPVFNQPTTCNNSGLTAAGVDLMTRLMNKGILIDIDHMSNKSLNQTINMANAVEPDGYPLVASHGLFFELHERLYGDATAPGSGQDGRHERLRTRAQLDSLRNLGSLVAVMTMDDVQVGDYFGSKQTVPYTPQGGSGFPTIDDDCRHSTKSWAQAYEYAVDVMQGPVALGSDFNGLAGHVGPRFGPDGCGGIYGGILDGIESVTERSRQDRFSTRLTYPFTNEFGTFDKQVTGQKTFDFNTEGLAHIGLLPDMLADAKVIGLTDQNLDPLYQSANRYIEVWEAASGGVCDISADSDEDGVFDSTDNCTLLANPTQYDSNGDGFGNRCDADLNNDCIVNAVDLGIFKTVFFTSNGDADLNGDGIVNAVDLGVLKSLFFTPPGPNASGTCP